MDASEISNSVLNVRPAVVVFFGEDAFPVRHIYEDLLGRAAGIQRVRSLSETADPVEWREELEDAFQLFTAISMKRAVDSELISDPEVHRVSIFIVIRNAAEKYADLIRTVVDCAQQESLADKLEFITITDVKRPDDLASKAESLHRPVESMPCSIQLQNTVLAVSDYWQGVRIGSDEQMCFALARIAALLSVSEYSLAEGHIGYLRNAVLGRRTYWVGLGAYSANRVDLAASIIYADLLRESLALLLSTNQKSIIGNLCDETYSALLGGVANRIGRSAASETETEAIRTEYATEVSPRILEEVCRDVKSSDELLTVLERLASRLRMNKASSAGGTSGATAGALMSLLVLSPEVGVAVAVVVAVVIAGIAWLVRNQNGNAKPDENNCTSIDETSYGTSLTVPFDELLADVLDDLRREIAAKLPSQRHEVNLELLASAPEGLLVGEKRLTIDRMIKSESARSAGRAVLRSTPHSLILLALESGKWRTPAVCRDLLSVQKDAIKAIASTLRQEFVDWALKAEQHRLNDTNFVQQVLYAPPPAPGANVSRVCIAPVDWALPELPLAVDRSYLPNCIHFMYLVETNVSN